MILLYKSLLILACGLTMVRAASLATRSRCEPFQSRFTASDVSHSRFDSSFIPLSPANSYQVSDGGLVLFMDKPPGHVKTKDGANNVVAEGATVNSTFTIL